MSNYTAIISRYHSKEGASNMEIPIPSRVTVTGKEDHFARAYEDTHMIIAGMRARDLMIGGDPDAVTIYRILSISSH